MKVYGLIGYPLDHSFSKQYFAKKFLDEKKNDCSFELFPLKDISLLPALLRNEKNLKGLSVTIPYKEAVIPYLSCLQQEAKGIGAVNCIKIEGLTLTGFNTDVLGFEHSLHPLLQPHHTKALILGNGGASKAVQFVLRKLGLTYLIVNRGNGRDDNVVAYASLNQQIINEYPVIINTSPVGMFPHSSVFPEIPYQFLNDKNLLFDLIYKPFRTRFLELGQANGAMIKNGLDMLVLQAEASWKIWNDPESSSCNSRYDN